MLTSALSAVRFLAARALAVLLAALLTAQPVAAQSILRDAETEALLEEMAAPLIRAAGLRPADVRIYLINDPSINAFVVQGQAVYVHSGLIIAATNANQVQGVIAHELGHIAGGHVARSSEGASRATGIMLLTLLLGAAAAAAGAGEAGLGIIAAGQQAALGSFLAYSRTQESTADAAGARYLSAAGISGRGSLDFFMTLQNQEFRYNIPQDDEQAYGRTHPLSGDRIRFLRDTYSADPAWDARTDANLEARFQRIRAKLIGFVSRPADTLRRYPESDMTIPALYARAYAWHKDAHPDRAMAAAQALVSRDPADPYFLELQGQILLESGRPREALPPLRAAVDATRGQPLIAALFGHALIATEDPANLAEAERVLRGAVARDRENPFAWYQLGIVYAQRGDEPRAALAAAERHSLTGNPGAALASADMAVAGLETGTPDWLRAQDIQLTARAEFEEQRRRERRQPPREVAARSGTTLGALALAHRH
jgi:predicted Zn-dependent protease